MKQKKYAQPFDQVQWHSNNGNHQSLEPVYGPTVGEFVG